MRSATLALLTVLTGCGARTALDVDDAAVSPDIVVADAARADTAAVDAPSRPDVTSPVDAPQLACARWTATAPLALTNPDRDRAPLAARVVGDRVWIGYQSSNPEPLGNQAWFTVVTDVLGAPVVGAQQVLPSPGELQSYGPLSLWTDPVAIQGAAMAWDEGRGCNIVRLGYNATPSGAPLRVANQDCSFVSPAGSGWSFLTRESPSGIFTQLHVVDASGRELSSLRLPDTPSAVTTATRIIFSDRSFLYAWAIGARVFTRHFDASGRPMSPTASYSAGVMVAGIRLVEMNDEVVLGWSGALADAASRIILRRITRDGAQTAPEASTIMPGVRLADWGLAIHGPDLALLWNAGPEGRTGRLRFATFDALTFAPRSMLEVSPVGWPHQLMLRATSRGFVGVYGALPEDGLTEVWTIGFTCAAR